MTVVFNDKELQRFVSGIEKKAAPLFDGAVNKTTAFTLRLVKTTLPKRSGNLRGSYMQKKIAKLTRRVFSPLKYAENIESGSRSKIIRPRRAKILTIPLRRSVLTSTRAQIKQSSLNTLFRRLKNKKGKTSRQIQNEVGIALAKKANIGPIRGQKNFERIIEPKSQAFLDARIGDIAIKLGFN